MTMDINMQQCARLERSLALSNTSSSATTTTTTTRSSGSPDSNRSPAPPTTPSYSPNLPTTTTTVPPRNTKRSFDVAFLMAPDDNLAKKQQMLQEKQLRLVSTGSLINRASPVATHKTSQRSPTSPHDTGLNSHNPLLGDVTESTVPRTYSEHALLGDITDNPVRNSGHMAGGIEVIPRQHNQRLMISTHQSKVGLFEQSGLLVPKTIYNHENLVDRVSKGHFSVSKSQDLNLINISSTRASFNHDDILETAGKGHADSNTNQDTNSANNTSAGLMIRSAFTKVTTSAKFDPSSLLNMPLPTSPSSVSPMSEGLSPDHVTYQDSMSPPTLGPGPTSPVPAHFMHPTPKQFQSPMPLLTPNQHLSPNSLPASTPSGGKSLTSYSSAAFLLQESNSTKHIKSTNGLCSSGVPVGSSNGNFRNDIDSYLMKASITSTNHHHHHHLYSTNDKDLLSGFPSTGSKLRPTSMLYHHPESVAAYSTLAAAAYPFAANFSSTAAELLVTRAPPPSLLTAATNPAAAAAAAVVSASLLPPSFAALSLPAQNVCAKCNISFRMTSDLVYHMRSHHKGDHINSDVMRRRREQEKLKCPVCSESFRERHHLTRHMTAHQDKEGDIVDEAEDGPRSDAGVEAGGRRRMTTSALIVAGHNAAAK